MAEGNAFSGVAAENFSHHQDTVAGQIRYRVIRHNLEQAIPDITEKTKPHPLAIVDVGGGLGLDSEWAAGRGHNVVLAEPSQQFVDSAIKLADGRFQVVQADAAQAAERYGKDPFDVTLSHVVLPYQENPVAHLQALAELTRTRGILSIATTNLWGKRLRLAKQHKFDEIDRLLETGHYQGDVDDDLDPIAYSSERMHKMLGSAGFNVLSWSGVRIIYDEDRSDFHNLPPAEFDRMVEEEIAASADPELRGVAQIQHFIARKK